jgi:predicted nucleotidyltransferase
MTTNWEKDINQFICLANEFKVRLLMVGGGAVNFHGYQRHSADVDFWIDMEKENLNRLINVFKGMGYDIDTFPDKVLNKEQNISVKFSPVDLNLELITNFDINKTFDEAFNESVVVKVEGQAFLKWNVLSLEDLIISKIKAGRPKDLLDIQELKRIKNIE